MSGMDNPGFDLSLPAAGNLSSSQFKAVILTASGLEVGSTDTPITGILQDNVADAAGKVARVRAVGVAFARAGASFAQGAYLEVDADGDLVAATNATDAVAQALEAADGVGAIVKVLIKTVGDTTIATV